MFKFELGQPVTITKSGAPATVHGRAEFIDGEFSYYLRWRAADDSTDLTSWHVEAELSEADEGEV